MKYNTKTAVHITDEFTSNELFNFFSAIIQNFDREIAESVWANESKIGKTFWVQNKGNSFDGLMFHDDGKRYKTPSDYTIIEGIPQNWREEMGGIDPQSKINQLETENKELREFLRISVDIIESFNNVEPYSLTEKESEYITQAKQLLNK